MTQRKVYIGFDGREVDAFAVARQSLSRNAGPDVWIKGLILSDLEMQGLYRRPMEIRDGRRWDLISSAPMSTEFAISRFFVPYLARTGAALFMDCDMLVRGKIEQLFDLFDPRYAVQVVKHDHQPAAGTKMDDQIQTAYPRKNWSSVCLFNCDHPANRKLTPDFINEQTGLALHQFRWLEDELIGELPLGCNWLVNHSADAINPLIVHFTDGVPSMKGHETDGGIYAEEWRWHLREWAR